MIDIGWFIGFVGGMLLAISYLPQMQKMWNRRHTKFKEISPYWFTIAFVGTVLMLVYGFVINQPSIVVLNVLCVFNYSFMGYLYKMNREGT